MFLYFFVCYLFFVFDFTLWGWGFGLTFVVSKYAAYSSRAPSHAHSTDKDSEKTLFFELKVEN